MEHGTDRQGMRSGGDVEQDAAIARAAVTDPLLARRASAPAIDIDGLYRDHRVRLTRLATAITLDRTLAEEVVVTRLPPRQ